MKQMKTLNTRGFSKEERRKFKIIVHGNVLDSIYALVKAVETHALQYSSAEIFVGYQTTNQLVCVANRDLSGICSKDRGELLSVRRNGAMVSGSNWSSHIYAGRNQITVVRFCNSRCL